MCALPDLLMLMHISAPLAPHTQCNRRLPFKEIFATTEPMNHKLPVSGCELHTFDSLDQHLFPLGRPQCRGARAGCRLYVSFAGLTRGRKSPGGEKRLRGLAGNSWFSGKAGCKQAADGTRVVTSNTNTNTQIQSQIHL